jgi:hypothetical protein
MIKYFKKWCAIGIISLLLTIGFSSVITAQNSTISPKLVSNNQSENIFSKRVNELSVKGNLTRHRILLIFVEILFLFRYVRSSNLLEKSMVWEGHFPELKHPLLYLRGMWLMFKSAIWIGFWIDISEGMDWNWNLFEWLITHT